MFNEANVTNLNLHFPLTCTCKKIHIYKKTKKQNLSPNILVVLRLSNYNRFQCALSPLWLSSLLADVVDTSTGICNFGLPHINQSITTTFFLANEPESNRSSKSFEPSPVISRIYLHYTCYFGYFIALPTHFLAFPFLLLSVIFVVFCYICCSL
jgi:hypothetical protein